MRGCCCCPLCEQLGRVGPLWVGWQLGLGHGCCRCRQRNWVRCNTHMAQHATSARCGSEPEIEPAKAKAGACAPSGWARAHGSDNRRRRLTCQLRRDLCAPLVACLGIQALNGLLQAQADSYVAKQQRRRVLANSGCMLTASSQHGQQGLSWVRRTSSPCALLLQ